MTTAHRPTWRSAMGGTNQGGNRVLVPSRMYSAKDLPGQLTMKDRAPEQVDAIRQQDFRADLAHRQATFAAAKAQGIERPPTDGSLNSLLTARTYQEWQQMELEQEREKSRALALSSLPPPPLQKKKVVEPQNQQEKEEELEEPLAVAVGADLDSGSGSESDTPFPQDADYKYSSDEEGSSDDDDDAELMREYERIKREKEEAEKRKAQQEAAEAALNGETGGGAGAYSLQRKWHEETVFKNQARDERKEGAKRRFINDTVRSDFHRKFLSKYVH